MTAQSASNSVFLQKLVTVIEGNLADENFGVTELAKSIHMSRSNLLRKVKQETGESVSIFIRNVRLKNAKNLLQDDSLTVSEISFKVGFNSTSYFTKCFRELYGYTPGQTGSIAENNNAQEISDIPPTSNKRSFKLAVLIIIAIVILSGIWFWFSKAEKLSPNNLAKSIAILPFKNDSSDSTNAYFINGLMGAILNNFQKIEDIEISGRATVEQYRKSSKTIPEMSKELNVSYFIEGSGQKVGNEVLLTIQLIEGSSGRQLWSKRYHREIKDVFKLQTDVAKSIAREINVIITPEEQKRIEKIPTKNLVAYDFYLKGLELLNDQTGSGLNEGIIQFKKAIDQDGKFASAYAYIAVSYYYLDLFRVEKMHTEEIKNYADKATMLDKNLGESLIAQGLYFMQIKEYDQAIKFLEEVLVYYPNTGWIHNFLSNIYGRILPDTEKYLEHTLQGIRTSVAGQDSVTASYSYLHLSNALAQTGFINEAETYIQKSLIYNPENLSSRHLSVFLRLGKNFDLSGAKTALIEVFQQDTSRLDVLQDIAKVCYTMEDYEEAWKYYDQFASRRKALQLDIFPNVDINIGFVLEQLGNREEATAYYDSFLEFTKNDVSLYKDLHYSTYYAVVGDVDKAIFHLKAFSEINNNQYWFVLFLETDPVMKQLAAHPDYEKTIKKINNQFWKNHQEIKNRLEEENIIIPKNLPPKR